MEIGISTASLYPTLLEDALAQLIEQQVPVAELFLNTFSELSPALREKVKSQLGQSSIRAVSVHPFTSVLESSLFFTSYSRRFEDGVELYRRYFDYAAQMGAKILVFHGNHRNTSRPPQRYYERFARLRQAAAADGYTVLLDGTNASDDAGDRPGMAALRELEVRSPLRECGVTKAQVRQLSRQAGLFTWNKPAYACLATRVPSGTAITAEDLARVERSEDALRAMGFSDLRVRLTPDGARLELPPEQIGRAAAMREDILAALGGDFRRLVLDLKPALTPEQLDQRILRDFDANPNKSFKNVVSGLFPAKLTPVMVALSGITPDKKVHDISREERQNFVHLIKNLEMTITGLRDYREAIITKGGVSVKEINPSTMESKLVKGLYFIGEVLDLDAVTGGFNLQIAWSTAYAAGNAV